MDQWGRPKGLAKRFPTPKQNEEASYFFEVFTPRQNAI
jgi:hypothetical protein